MERCPACRAPYKGESPCYRCGADLSLLLRAETRAGAWTGAAVRRLAAGDVAGAEAALRRVVRLKQADLSRALWGFLQREKQRRERAAELAALPPGKAAFRHFVMDVRMRLRKTWLGARKVLGRLLPKGAASRRPTDAELARLTAAVCAAAQAVYRATGPGLDEAVYEECLCRELTDKNIICERQVAVPLRYQGHPLESGRCIPLLVEKRLAVLVQPGKQPSRIHRFELENLIRLGGWDAGLMFNFRGTASRRGVPGNFLRSSIHPRFVVPRGRFRTSPDAKPDPDAGATRG